MDNCKTFLSNIDNFLYHVLEFLNVSMIYFYYRVGKEMEVVKKQRLSNFELMRIISMFMIVIWHLITRSNILDHCSETIYIILKFIQYFTIVHVNSFVLVTGYFQYKSTFKINKVTSLLGQSLFYRILFVVIFSLLGIVSLSQVDIIKNVFPLDVTNNYWFLNAYVVLLCLSPFLNKLIENIDQRQHRRLIFIMILLFSIIPNLSYQSNIKNDGFMVVHFILLYFVGSYFAKYPIKNNIHFKNYSKNKKQVILIAIFYFSYLFNFLLYNFCNYLISFDSPLIREVGYYFRSGCELYSGIMVLIQSFSYFLFFETLSIRNKLINSIASLTLGVYLIHENLLVREQLYKFLNLDVDYVITSTSVVGRIFIYAILIFIICLLIEKIRVIIFKTVNKCKFIIKIKHKFHKFVIEF